MKKKKEKKRKKRRLVNLERKTRTQPTDRIMDGIELIEETTVLDDIGNAVVAVKSSPYVVDVPVADGVLENGKFNTDKEFTHLRQASGLAP